MITDDDSRYEHDMARRKAVELLSRERVKEGLDTKLEADEWGQMAKTDKEVWCENEAEEMGWIIEHLEAKNEPFNEGFMATDKGKLAAWRDFLHATLRLENNGGVPDRIVPGFAIFYPTKHTPNTRNLSAPNGPGNLAFSKR